MYSIIYLSKIYSELKTTATEAIKTMRSGMQKLPDVTSFQGEETWFSFKLFGRTFKVRCQWSLDKLNGVLAQVDVLECKYDTLGNLSDQEVFHSFRFDKLGNFADCYTKDDPELTAYLTRILQEHINARTGNFFPLE